MIIQIYAFMDAKEALQAAEMGVDQIGFVVGDYGLVPGELTFSQGRNLREAIRGYATASALTMSADIAEILRMATAVDPDILHISNDVEDVNEFAMAELRKNLPQSIRLMKAIPVGGEETYKLIDRFAPVSDIILLDTKVCEMPGVGATGHTHDWSISRQIVESCGRPIILAGGLTSENVCASIKAVRPWGVDSNTHTNVPGDRQKKDLQRIEAFVKAVQK